MNFPPALHSAAVPLNNHADPIFVLQHQGPSILILRINVEPNLSLGISMGNDRTNGNCVVNSTRSSQFSVGDILESVNGQTLSSIPMERRVRLLQGQVGLRTIVVRRKASYAATPRPTAPAGVVAAHPRALQTVSINTARNATTKKAPPKSVPSKPSNNTKKTTITKKKPTPKRSAGEPGIHPPLDLLNDLPTPGTVDKNGSWYSTVNNETLKDVADKLGLDDNWQLLALQPSNKIRFSQPRAPLKGSTRFQPYTLVKLPATECSQWKLKKLVPKETIETSKTLVSCFKCLRPEVPNQDILLCDGCDAACHLPCAGLTRVPSGDWLCDTCQDILEARRTMAPDTLQAKLRTSSIPDLPPLQRESMNLLGGYVTAQKEEALQDLERNQTVLHQALKDRLASLEEQCAPLARLYFQKRYEYNDGLGEILDEHGLRGYNLREYIMLANGTKIFESKERVGYSFQGLHTQRWKDAKKKVLECDRDIKSRLRSK